MSKNILSDPKTIGCLLGLITLALFWPATHFGFIELDDDNYVSANPFVQQGFTRQSLAWATTESYENYWLPMTWLSFILDRTIQGPEPGGFHLTNVLLHAANVMLLFVIGHRFTGHLWGSALLAALFGWHPLRVEAVVWISSRKDVLSSFFGLIALLAYDRYVRRRPHVSGGRQVTDYSLVFIAMALALMAKPMWVTLPFVLLLLDFWPLQRFGWPVSRGRLRPGDCAAELDRLEACPTAHGGRFSFLVMEKVPLLLLTVVFVLITLSTHRSSGALHETDAASLLERLLQLPANYCRYLWKMFWPVHLAVRYPMMEMPWKECIVSAGWVVSGSAFCFWWSRRWPWALLGCLWFLGTFVPIIGLVRIGSADFADRFTYLPSIGISLLLVGALLTTFSGRFTRARLMAATLLLAVCALATRHQLQYWADGERLFRRALQVTRNNPTAHNALGRTLEKEGRWQEALVEYQASLKIAPQFGQAHANLANVLGLLHRYDEAMEHFQAALQGTAEDAKIHSNYGSILYDAGQKAQGMSHLREAIRLNPHLADAHFNLGHALLDAGDQVGALEHFVSAARINPQDDAAQFQAGRLYLGQGDRERARSCFEAAVRLRPDELKYSEALREAK